ncbi:hypothetical protein M432DRAFT_640573 [Thermoascus aurantiacus ATCC 26904]
MKPSPFHLQRLRAPLFFFYILSIFIGLSTAQDSTSTSDSSDAAIQNEAGAAGPSTGSIDLSTRDQIIIFTIVGVAVVFGVTSAILYLIAKRRQWKVRASIRRSARRVTEAIRTPLTPRFPKSPGPGPRRDLQQQRKDSGNDAPTPRLPKLRDGEGRSFTAKRFGPGNNIPNNKNVARSEERKNQREQQQQPDLEKGLKLERTKTGTETTETIAPTNSDGSSVGSDRPVPVHVPQQRRGWGTLFSFGRN